MSWTLEDLVRDPDVPDYARDQLRAELAELRKDKKRLDWLEQAHDSAWDDVTWMVADGKTPRQAIDKLTEAIDELRGEE